ncbi:MAG: competence/damage-inducible protein A [Candidatus Sumerlaeia bacterium]
MSKIYAGILSTGTEILQGMYADTNGQWLSERLTEAGIVVRRIVAAPDRAEEVSDAIGWLVGQCDIVLMTGGLGPTEDDLTRQAVCRIFNRQLQEDSRAWKMIVHRFKTRGTKVPESNKVQCMIPTGAEVLYNKWGTAPGFVIHDKPDDLDRTVFFAAMPGPPREMRPMFGEYLEKKLLAEFGSEAATRIRTLHTYGISESSINGMLRPLFEETREHPEVTLALLAGQARVDVRVTVRGQSREAMRKTIRRYSAKVRRRIPKGCIYGADDDTLEIVVNRLLRKYGKTLAVAESCTGGLVAKRLTDIPGSSKALLEGWVTYSNEAKQAHLGVRARTLEKFGAVSEETAREMALGALKRSGADIAVSTTGIAGPGGGSAKKPVGLVWYGIAWKEAEGADKAPDYGVATARTSFRSTRELVRIFASHRALDLVRRHLLGLPFDLPISR